MVLAIGCTDHARETSADAAALVTSATPAASVAPPPSASAADGLGSSSLSPSASPSSPAPPPLRCPRGMMRVANTFCVDRWEASLIDRVTGMPLSPYYPPDRRLALQIAATWEHDHLEIGSEDARRMPVPELPLWQRDHDADPLAISKPGVKPNGYVSSVVAARACENAQKRLCHQSEWVQACEGESARQFPYGERYTPGACNVFRAMHPGIVLHDNPSIGHFDPRMNLVAEKDGAPLLRLTGATPRCQSEWSGDTAWDMNGNLDEWVTPDEGEGDAGAPAAEGKPDAGKASSNGLFLGGFYSRSTREGCRSRVSQHQVTYFDYSTGVRCCWSP
jgi:sulfatase modifying factor 1